MDKRDAKFLCFSLQKLLNSHWLLKDDSVMGAIECLKNLSNQFALDLPSNEKFQLSEEDEEVLEKLWLKLICYEKENHLSSFLSQSKNSFKLKVKRKVYACQMVLYLIEHIYS